MTSNMDMYTKHLASWAQKEKTAGFRSYDIPAQDHVEPEVVPEVEDAEEDTEE